MVHAQASQSLLGIGLRSCLFDVLPERTAALFAKEHPHAANPFNGRHFPFEDGVRSTRVAFWFFSTSSRLFGVMPGRRQSFAPICVFAGSDVTLSREPATCVTARILHVKKHNKNFPHPLADACFGNR